MYSCLFVGTTRLLSHREYAGFRCIRDPGLSLTYILPSGFLPIVPSLPSEFGVLLEDLSALCSFVDTRFGPSAVPIHEFPIDDFQACIESRIVDLLSESRSSKEANPIYQACLFAAFLCTYKLSTGIWEGCFIPEFCATQALELVSSTKDDPIWGNNRELLLWLLFVCGALAERRPIRLRAMVMIQSLFRDQVEGVHEEWIRLEGRLRTFIWSQHAMERRYRWFWEEMYPEKRVSKVEALYHDVAMRHAP